MEKTKGVLIWKNIDGLKNVGVEFGKTDSEDEVC